jgi:hypothetical protein
VEWAPVGKPTGPVGPFIAHARVLWDPGQSLVGPKSPGGGVTAGLAARLPDCDLPHFPNGVAMSGEPGIALLYFAAVALHSSAAEASSSDGGRSTLTDLPAHFLRPGRYLEGPRWRKPHFPRTGKGLALRGPTGSTTLALVQALRCPFHQARCRRSPRFPA